MHISGNVIAQGGVALAMHAFTDVDRDKKGVFSAKSNRPAENWYQVAAAIADAKTK